MDALTEVMTALAAGAGAGARDTATAAVKDAYAALRAAVLKRFSGRVDAQSAFEAQEASRQAGEEVPADVQLALRRSLAEVGVDDAVLALARQVLGAAGHVDERRFAVEASTVQGLQQGDHNTQNATFGR